MEILNIRFNHLLIHFVLIMQYTCMLMTYVNSLMTDVLVQASEKVENKIETGHRNNDIVQNNHDLLKRITGYKYFVNSRKKRNSIQSKKKCSGFCERSLCPWTISLDRDSERVPEVLEKAACKNTACQFPHSSSKLKVLTACEPVTIDIQVYRNNSYTFEKNWPVACVCTKRNFSRNKNRTSKVTGSRRRDGKRKRKRRLNRKHEVQKPKQGGKRLPNKRRKENTSKSFNTDIINNLWVYQK